MAGKVGDRISIDSAKVGISARQGEILKVFESAFGEHYLVRWADGRETDIRPRGGTAMITPAARPRKRKGA